MPIQSVDDNAAGVRRGNTGGRGSRIVGATPLRTLLIVAVVFLAGQRTSLVQAERAPRPNFVVILVDDMGFSDLGCYGGEIATPNLDRLAAGGLRFTQFYNTGRCWPTRGALLTGYYPQAIRRDQVPGFKSGGRGIRPSWAPLLASRLKKAGYRSYHSGKWHLDGMPCGSGFDHSYYLRDQQRFFSPRVHFLDDKKLPAVSRGSGFYGTVAIANRAIEFLQDHVRSHRPEPFFLYLAFTAPHFPLHALPRDIKRYRHRYDGGWEKNRAARWSKIETLGLVNGTLSAVERQLGPPYDFPQAMKILGAGEVNRPLPWNDLTEAQRRFQAAKMEIHAAMVDRIDQEVGRVLQQLTAMNAIDDTLILFLSDNGASAEIMVRGDGHDPQATPGSAATHLCLGPGWSTSSNTPFRRHKTWVHEGGIATPFIAHWPKGIPERGVLRKTPGHVVDLAPTLLELAGLKPQPATKDAPPLHGKSLAQAFTRDTVIQRDYLWWLHEGNRAIRQGDWKLVAAKGDKWELYDLSRDRTETTNLAARFPDKVRKLESLWDAHWTQMKKLAAQR